jgi:hypothetical protein
VTSVTEKGLLARKKIVGTSEEVYAPQDRQRIIIFLLPHASYVAFYYFLRKAQAE